MEFFEERIVDMSLGFDPYCSANGHSAARKER